MSMKKYPKKSKVRKIPILVNDKTENPLFHHYNFFKNNLIILSKLNEIFSGTFDAYINNMAKQSTNKKDRSSDTNEEKFKEIMRSLTNEPSWHFAITTEFLEFLLSSYKNTFYLKEKFHNFLHEMILVFLVSQLELMLENNLI